MEEIVVIGDQFSCNYNQPTILPKGIVYVNFARDSYKNLENIPSSLEELVIGPNQFGKHYYRRDGLLQEYQKE